MKRLYRLPSEFRRYTKVGGVLDFAVFDDADGTTDAEIAAIGAALGNPADFDHEALRTLDRRAINRAEFLGDRFDMTKGKLIKRGSWRPTEGKELTDPPLDILDTVKIGSGASGIPVPGAGGEFARAFSQPPYSLRAKPSEVQALFDAIHDFLLPRQEPYRIHDWISTGLPQVSSYFQAGADWWGVFLFTIHHPSQRRLIAIAGSTTD